MTESKRIALVAHNNKNTELIQCLRPHRSALVKHKLYSTDTTGLLIEKKLELAITKYEIGPLGGDQQLAAKITARELDILIFFVDPLDSHPDTADVQALLRLAQVYGLSVPPLLLPSISCLTHCILFFI
jgi:methylglyoxal synthase